jgi:hypothetical protein
MAVILTMTKNEGKFLVSKNKLNFNKSLLGCISVADDRIQDGQFSPSKNCMADSLSHTLL